MCIQKKRAKHQNNLMITLKMMAAIRQYQKQNEEQVSVAETQDLDQGQKNNQEAGNQDLDQGQQILDQDADLMINQ